MFLRIIRRLTRWLRNLSRDVRFLSRMVPAILRIKRIAARNPGLGSWSVAVWWEEDVVSEHSDRVALIYGGSRYTYSEVDAISNRCARTAMRAGIEPGGSTVALSVESSPEFIFWMLGLVKIGTPVALINPNVKGAGLAQCLSSCGARWLVHSDATREQVATLADLDQTLRPNIDYFSISDADEGVSSDRLPPGLRKDLKYSDTALHIFTSGTSGLPKAAKISHLRFYGSSLIFSHLIGFKRNDVLYCPLPLYHSSAIVLGLGICFHNGLPFVFSRKFSVSNFWSTCIANNVTVIQYIGELCRYLVAPKATAEERQHSVRMALGNGLNRSVWETFQKRSGIPKIVEFYAATEANVGLVNTVGKTGAIGVLSPLLSKKHPGKLFRFDFDAGQPYRDKEGRCIECEPNEVGEFVGMINPKDPTQKFDGYSDKAETEKKLLRNVLTAGDSCFRSGDLMTRDEDGFMYFVDRIGDTIRWKGENVSTSEVEVVI